MTMRQFTLLPQFRTSNGGKGVKTIRHPTYSPDIVPTDLFLYQRVKTQLAGVSLS
jgi:hypothetical protein